MIMIIPQLRSPERLFLKLARNSIDNILNLNNIFFLTMAIDALFHQHLSHFYTEVDLKSNKEPSFVDTLQLYL